GTAFGLLLTGVTGAFLPDAVHVKFDVLTLLVFAIVLMIVSVLGSLFSILTIRKIFSDQTR
ncbi:ABC transporter permease, partial [Staphylococcus aureus]